MGSLSVLGSLAMTSKTSLTGTRTWPHLRKSAFQSHFAYNYNMSALNISHPALHWEQDAHQLHEAPKLRLRLAAMAGHMRLDKIAARRAALIDLLADGRPHPREEIWASVSAQLEADCWGKRPHESLAHDLDVLRQGGLRIGYSRRPQTVGYYLQYPSLRRPAQPPRFETTNWTWIEHLRQLSGAEKNQIAFSAADLALRQKRLLLAKEHPDWSDTQVEQEARRQVFSVTLPIQGEENGSGI